MSPTLYDRYTEDLMRRKQAKRTTLGLVALKAGSVVISHPIDYARTLIQMGYEPVPPYATHTLLGKPAIGLPGLLSYLGHVKKADGFLGLWRGLQPKLVLVAVQGISCQAGLNLFDWATGIPPPSSECTSEPGDPDEVDDYIQESTGVLVRKAATAVVRDCTGKAVAVVCSQPFHVITIRCMAQFIGRETKYNGMFSSIRAVVSDNGWSGFFSGLIPRLLGEMATIVLTHSLLHLTRFAFPDLNRRIEKGFNFTNSVVCLVATSITYPFTVVSTCMAVSCSGLIAGSPPHMPNFPDWSVAWTELSRHNQLERGSSMLKRYYKGSPNLGLSIVAEPRLDQFRDPKIKLM